MAAQRTQKKIDEIIMQLDRASSFLVVAINSCVQNEDFATEDVLRYVLKKQDKIRGMLSDI